ncbi:hypothetical protein ZWY2020_016336 [Hordeum vulgare]|nr:hypothetical protein ZWY2020_016336 [Hordeum vulgare]
MLSTLLMAPTTALFFLRAAGSELSEANKQAFFLVAILVGLIGLVLEFCGFPEVSYLLLIAAVLCKLLLIALLSIFGAAALWRMNPQQPAAVAVVVV